MAGLGDGDLDINGKQFTLSDKASFRAIGEEGVVLMVDSGQLYSTNTTGTAFLTQIADHPSADRALDALLADFDVDRETLAADLGELLGYLVDEGVVIVQS